MRNFLLHPIAIRRVNRFLEISRPSEVRRSFRYKAFDADLDQEQLAAARKWYQSFKQTALPKGNTIFSRSSGPGGQHVNKTETKATTCWPVSELLGLVPAALHKTLRSSKYYSRSSDSLIIQAQTQRSRTANLEDNRTKLYEELGRIYHETVPGETSPDKKQKYQAIEKSFHEGRIQAKKKQSSKKLLRGGRRLGDLR